MADHYTVTVGPDSGEQAWVQAGPWLQEGGTVSVMGQQLTLTSEAYGHAHNLWQPHSYQI